MDLDIDREMNYEHDTPVTVEKAGAHLAEEMADVGIVLEALKQLDGLEADVETWRVAKVSRMMLRLQALANDRQMKKALQDSSLSLSMGLREEDQQIKLVPEEVNTQC